MSDKNNSQPQTDSKPDALGAIAEQNLKNTDSSSPNSNFVAKLIHTVVSFIIKCIFENPPFMLETIAPIRLFQNKYFKTFSISLIYLGLILSLITFFKPTNNHDMFYVYAICFWITVLILSFWIISPYDENSVEYMLRDQVIKKVEKTVEELKKEQDDKLKEEQANKLKEGAEGTEGAEGAEGKSEAQSSLTTAVDQYGNALTSSNGDPILNGPDGLFLMKSKENNSMIVVNKDGSPVMNEDGKQILFDELTKKFTNSDKQPIIDVSSIKSFVKPEILKTSDNVSYIIKDGIKYAANDKGEIALDENGAPLQLDQVDSSGKIKQNIQANKENKSKYPDTFQGKDQEKVETILKQ
jgi:hypothetical protein